MITLVLLAALGSDPKEPTPPHFDQIEINHYYRWSGNQLVVLDKVLFKDWSPLDREFIVHGWQTLRGCRDKTDKAAKAKWEKALGVNEPGAWLNHEWPKFYGAFVPDERYPIHDGRVFRGTYSVNGETIEVTADSFIETHTTYDPERLNVKHFPDEVRLGITRDRKPAYRVSELLR